MNELTILWIQYITLSIIAVIVFAAILSFIYLWVIAISIKKYEKDMDEKDEQIARARKRVAEMPSVEVSPPKRFASYADAVKLMDEEIGKTKHVK